MSLPVASPLRLAALAVAALLALSACKQGAGDRCEIDSDCESGLTCDSNDVCSVRSSSGAGGTPGAGGSGAPDGGNLDGAGGSDAADVNHDAVDAPAVPDSGDTAADTSEAGGGDATDATAG
jgi:hypothetical protein